MHSKLVDWMQAPVEFAYRTGWRANEVLGLRWSEIRFDLKVIKLPGRGAKNGKDRPVGLSGKVLELLERQREVVAQEVEWVFPDEDGRSRITYDRAVDRFQGACSQVQLPEGSSPMPMANHGSQLSTTCGTHSPVKRCAAA